MKLDLDKLVVTESEVAPYVGAWIETAIALQKYKEVQVAPYVGAWIET